MGKENTEFNRFDRTAVAIYYAFKVPTPEYNANPEELLMLSQEGLNLGHIAFQVWQTVDRYPRMQGPIAKLQVIQASAVLPNLAWYDGPHLESVVAISSRVLAGGYPLMAEESSAGGLKNATWYDGPHVQGAIHTAIRGYFRHESSRVRYDCIRTILHASRYYPELLEDRRVREILDTAAHQKNNDVMAKLANELLEKYQ